MDQFLQALMTYAPALLLIGGVIGFLANWAWKIYDRSAESKQPVADKSAYTIQNIGISLDDHHAALRQRESEVRFELKNSAPTQVTELEAELTHLREEFRKHQDAVRVAEATSDGRRPDDVSTEMAGWAVAEPMAMTFVDIMRLLYTANSDSPRFTDFVALARRHFSDFRYALTRFGGSLAAPLEEQTVTIDRQMSYAVAELEKRTTADIARMFVVARELSELVHNFCSRAATSKYAATLEILERAQAKMGQSLDSQLETTPRDEIFRLRLNLQSAVLDVDSSKPGLRSIAHDAKQQLAFPYFVIDRALLERMKP